MANSKFGSIIRLNNSVIDIESIIIANFKRAQESSRVLEELYKLEDIPLSETFKTIRYELYNLEKEIILKNK